MIFSALKLCMKSARRAAFLAFPAQLTAISQVPVSGGSRLKGVRMPSGRGGGLASWDYVGNGIRVTCNKSVAGLDGGRSAGTTNVTRFFLEGLAKFGVMGLPSVGEEGFLLRLY